MKAKINELFDSALKKAELMIEDQQFISGLLDAAFAQLGRASEFFYDVQDQVLALIRMTRAWLKREYTEVSPKAIVGLIASLIYFVNPFDFITDFIPFVGWIDDLAVFTYVLRLFNKEIERYMAWESERTEHSGRAQHARESAAAAE